MLQRGCAEPQDETQDQGEDEEFVEASPAPGGGAQGHIPWQWYISSHCWHYISCPCLTHSCPAQHRGASARCSPSAGSRSWCHGTGRRRTRGSRVSWEYNETLAGTRAMSPLTARTASCSAAHPWPPGPAPWPGCPRRQGGSSGRGRSRSEHYRHLQIWDLSMYNLCNIITIIMTSW